MLCMLYIEGSLASGWPSLSLPDPGSSHTSADAVSTREGIGDGPRASHVAERGQRDREMTGVHSLPHTLLSGVGRMLYCHSFETRALTNHFSGRAGFLLIWLLFRPQIRGPPQTITSAIGTQGGGQAVMALVDFSLQVRG
ncbi:hypothetical protein N7510_009792 [Penicillium lagena]|uniref:uncharacterized protein n=1 Tax=Penicillium lagena TaxID=94218 RepID=UPI002540947D|nr:uncharacterized protein N7510_009792 [Penicillium lagena]KAJ5604638.1 hypothetical protein N7510_009792 [Penicillium lagena]